MPLSLELAFTYLLTRKRQSLVSMIGVSLGVAVFIGMAALMFGFQTYFIAKIIDVSPHVVMKDEHREPHSQPVKLAYQQPAAVELQSLKPRDEMRGIKEGMQIVRALAGRGDLKVAPTLRGEVFLRYGSKDVNATLIGIDPVREPHVTHIRRDLIAGSLEALHNTANGLILGDGLQKKIGAQVGDTISVISPANVKLRMKVVGTIRTGITTMDNTEAYALIKKSQVLQNRPNVVNQIRIRLPDAKKAAALAVELERHYGYRTESWEESNRNVLSIFVIQQSITFSSVGAVLIVAAFGIFNIISTVVYEKTRDIAILKSMGLSEADVRRTFLIQGLLVGVAGTLCGWFFGFCIIRGLASIRFHLEGFITAEGFVLYESSFSYLVSAAFAITSAAFAGYLPARKAAKLRPVEIIRSAA